MDNESSVVLTFYKLNARRFQIWWTKNVDSTRRMEYSIMARRWTLSSHEIILCPNKHSASISTVV